MSIVRGIILAGDSDKLIVQATTAEVKAIAAGTQVLVRRRLDALAPVGFPWAGETLYDEAGVPVCTVTEVNSYIVAPFDASTYGDPWRSVSVKAARFEIKARGFVV